MLRQTFLVTTVSIVLLLLLSGTIWGRSAPIHYGVIGGINMATLAYDEQEGIDRKARIGLGIGGFVEYPVTPIASLRGGLLFLQKGEKWESSFMGEDSEGTTKYSYLGIPVLVRASSPRGCISGGFSPFVMGGPELGILLSAEDTYEMYGESQTHDIKDGTKSIDLALTVGGGVEYKVGVASYYPFVTVQYSIGLLDICEEGEGEEAFEAKTRGLQIFGGVRF